MAPWPERFSRAVSWPAVLSMNATGIETRVGGTQTPKKWTI